MRDNQTEMHAQQRPRDDRRAMTRWCRPHIQTRTLRSQLQRTTTDPPFSAPSTRRRIIMLRIMTALLAVS